MKDQCPECSGMGSITIAVDTGTFGTGYFREEICEWCDGEGEVEATCDFCDGPLADDGECAACTEPLTAEQLTETIGDSFKARKAA